MMERTAATKPTSGLPSHRILLVDDAPSSCFMLRKLLEALGQEVLTAESGVQALAVLEQSVPDLVISDIGMPGMDGYELARRIRQDARWSGVVLVALTGYGLEDDRELARAAGFDRYLVKPASIQSLKPLLADLHSSKPMT